MEILGKDVIYNELNQNSKGGTELMGRRLYESFEPSFFDDLQIILSRARELAPDKRRILWCHDLPGDPEADKALGNHKWENFNKIVFVSQWQRQGYLARYQIPWSKTIVLNNGIVPFSTKADISGIKKGDTVKFIYHTTPHRGLELLVPVFTKLCEKFDNIELHVYSSFGIYGWDDRDQPYKGLFDIIEQHPKMHYHGIVSNADMREILPTMHFYAYPCIWPETSCLSLIEAMSAGLVCVHPDFAVLPETSFSLNHMYNFHEDVNSHAMIFFNTLDTLLTEINTSVEMIAKGAQFASSFADSFYNWDICKRKWEMFLQSVKKEDIIQGESSDGYFVYRT